MTFLPFKSTLIFTDSSILSLLVFITFKHPRRFNFQSWLALFNALCMIWLSFRLAFWILTTLSITQWMGSTFYILYWVPTPISFAAYMLVPIYFAEVLYKDEFRFYWHYLRWVYGLVTAGLSLFMISWSILSAMSIKKEYECLGSSNFFHGEQVQIKECYRTGYSSQAFRYVTAICFLFLAATTAVFGLRLSTHTYNIDESRFLGPSTVELTRINIFLFGALLSRGLYEVFDVLDIFQLPDIPLQVIIFKA